MGHKEDALPFLLALNEELAEKEGDETAIVGPGLPPIVGEPRTFVTSDCVRAGVQT